MNRTRSVTVPPFQQPGYFYPKRTQKLPSNQSSTGGSKHQYEVGTSSTQQHHRRRRDSDYTAATIKPRSKAPEDPKRQLRTEPNKQYQRARRDSYSGAIEGCSRDHHPECYPDIRSPNKSIITGHDKDREDQSPAGRSRAPSPTSSSSSSVVIDGRTLRGYRAWLRRNYPQAFQNNVSTGTGATNKPSRKGKESPLTMEDRMFFMGIRPRPEVKEEPSLPTPAAAPAAAPAPAPASSSSSSPSSPAPKGPTIGGFVTYPQIDGYHDPTRANDTPLVVTNPDSKSRAERVRDGIVREQRATGTSRRGSIFRPKPEPKPEPTVEPTVKVKAKAGDKTRDKKTKRSSRGILNPKKFLRLF
ncbi:hypothetical protein VM1G_02657 [Cytospora mali]|uniref:Uncharacterized protein n=1 Tax=Cytospora mali TaxID=578113 RepID=A0A194VT32_CYTMA|nr:hypothetical protein VM1G_02657 [Valsa mali]